MIIDNMIIDEINEIYFREKYLLQTLQHLINVDLFCSALSMSGVLQTLKLCQSANL